MTNQEIPFIAIVGGFWDLEPDKAAKAKALAAALGGELAKAGMGLVVYNSHENSLEPHVVSGYVASLSPGSHGHPIRVRFAESQKSDVRFAEQDTHADLFDLRLFASQDWEAPFYRSLVEAEGVDGILLMAGARSTLIAGQIALARPLPLLAVDEFDGAASVVRTELATRFKDYPSSATHSVRQQVEWLKEECARRAEELAKARQQASLYARMTVVWKRTLWAVIAFVLLLASLDCGLVYASTPKHYPAIMIFGLIAAGATGALVRAVFWASEESGAIRSLLLGAVTGFVVGLVYLVPQWVSASGVLDPKATVVGATDKIQFVSAVIVAITAGIGFDVVLSRLRSQADALPTAIARGS